MLKINTNKIPPVSHRLNLRDLAGFALPVVIVVGTILMVTMAYVLRSISAGRSIMTNQHYQLLARQAAESGIAMAEACIRKDGKVSWTTSKPLKPNTDCSGNVSPSLPLYVIDNSDFKTTFEVGVNSSSSTAVEYRSKGTANRYGADGAVSSFNSDSISSYVSLSPGGMTAEPLYFKQFGTTETGGAFCGITPENQIKCWGYLVWSRFGNGGTWHTEYFAVPVTNPTGITGWNDVSSNYLRNCGIASNLQAYCWGEDGEIGLLGTGVAYTSGPFGTWPSLAVYPVKVKNPTGVTGWRKIEVNGNTACGIANDNNIYCWGSNYDSAIGTGSTSTSYFTYSPVKVHTPSGVTWKDVSANYMSFCAISSSATAANNNQLYCWGYNGTECSLGTGTATFVYRPTAILKPTGVSDWSQTDKHYSLSSNGQIYITTRNSSCTRQPVPKPAGAGTWVSISGDGCAVDSNKHIYCADTFLGTNFVRIPRPAGVEWKAVQRFSGSTQPCAIATDNTVWCWGHYRMDSMLDVPYGQKPTTPAKIYSSPGTSLPPQVNKFIRF